MNPSRFTMRKLAFFVAAAYAPGAFAAQAARVEFATNEPVIVSADGRERPARKGEAVVPGERVLTRAGRAQLAFTDGAFVSLQPNTDFGVTEYTFNGANDGKEKSVLSLVKGALRTITGLIGRSKRDAYVMQTPTATIGIRGTGGRIEVNDRGTFVAGTSGTWFMSTPGGTVDIPAGAFGFAGPNRDEPPKQTNTAPNTPPVTAPLAGFVAPDQVGADGGVVVVPPAAPAPKMLDGSGYAVRFAFSSGGPSTPAGSNATFAGGVSLASFQDSVFTQSVGSAQLSEYGNDGVVGWGRWTNGTVNISGSPVPFTTKEGLHYVVGIPTATLPTGPANYTVIGATAPTDVAGVLAPGVLSSLTMAVDFDIAQITMGITINMSGSIHSVSGSFAAASTFAGSGLTGYSGACAGSGCFGDVNGAFYGSSAERAGITYKIYNDTTSQTFIGAAALTK